MSASTTDRIVKQTVLRAPRARVWRALTDSKEFGAWFQCLFEGPFVPGGRIKGRITYPGYEHFRMEITVEAMEPEGRFSFRWQPHPVDPGADFSNEPTTLVEFTLEDAEGGTLLTVTESGFDQLPIDRRAEALKRNESGWAEQMKSIAEYLRRNP